MPISWLHIESFRMHAWILYSFGTLTYWLWWLICLDWGFWDSYFFYTSLIYLFKTSPLLIILIDLIASLSTLTLILSWLFWSPHMHTLTTVYHLAWHVDSLVCVLSWSSLSMMFISPFVLIVIVSLILCVDMVIYLRFAWLCVAWLPSFCVIACRLTVWVAHLSPYLQPSSFGHFLHSGSHFSKCETLCVIVL